MKFKTDQKSSLSYLNIKFLFYKNFSFSFESGSNFLNILIKYKNANF